MGQKNTWLAQVTSPDTGQGNVTTKRKPTGQKHRPEETRGQRGWGGKGSQQRGGISRNPGPGRQRGLSGRGEVGAVGAARCREDEARDRGANKPTSMRCRKGRGVRKWFEAGKRCETQHLCGPKAGSGFRATLKQNGGAPLALTKTSELAGDGGTGAGI